MTISGCADIARKEQKRVTAASIPGEAQKCIDCHQKLRISNIALHDWQSSSHAERGVTCVESYIPVSDASSTIIKGSTLCNNKSVRRSVSSKNCEECHSEQSEQFAKGKHAEAWNVLEDLKKIPEISNTFNIEQDCSGCHRIGRNGGKCDSCHTRHRFAASEARRPEAAELVIWVFYIPNGKLITLLNTDLSIQLKDKASLGKKEFLNGTKHL